MLADSPDNTVFIVIKPYSMSWEQHDNAIITTHTIII